MLYRPFLFVATFVVTCLVMMGESKSAEHIKYTSVTGFFQQDDLATDSGSFDYVCFSWSVREMRNLTGYRLHITSV